MAEHAAPDNSMRAVSHVPKFDGTNHREWNYEIDLCFQNLDIADVVLGLELCPDETTLIPEHMVAHRSHMHLGSFVRIPDTATKLGARSQEGVFVGRCNTQNAFRIYIPKTRKVVVSKDVKIDEQILYRDTNNSSPLTDELDIVDTDDHAMDVDKDQPSVDQTPEDNEHQTNETETPPAGANLNEITIPLDDSNHDVDDENLPRKSTRVNEVPSDDPIHQRDVDCAPQQTRRSTRSPKYSERYIQWQQSLAKVANLSSMSAKVHDYKRRNLAQTPPPRTRSHRISNTLAV
ncbi:hypothetical protein GHT06_007414 [Daphnia sinensis]|uniref:Retroviral polymerase SH3-like domain-containing protein n=1 Tax=Daphnia sinensis TaxID=1820382 RepID=A0AAD5PLN5_9CRUS|nr:hypothetical protein GHT06_007414 [Daphnia sinensis]